MAVAALALAPFALAGAATTASAATWPGGADVQVASDFGFGSNLSGVAYQASGSDAPGVLWAVQNNPSKVYRLIFSGGRWTPDPTNGWANGKTLRYPDGGGVPDAEGITLAGGEAGAVYVSTERNDVKAGGADKVSRPGILRLDVSGAAAELVATQEWNFATDLPGLDANEGLEAVTWVPDSLLTAKGFRDEATGAAYSPATYANHGGGIFFVGVERVGQVVGYALNGATGDFTRVATISSGLSRIMDLSYDPDTTHLWAVCDDKCNGQSTNLDIATSGAEAGRFGVTATFDRPAGMANLNNEGFAIAPDLECRGGVKPVFWTDDGNFGGQALRSGTLNCAAAGNPPVVNPPVENPPVVNPPVVNPPVVNPPVVVPPVVDTPIVTPPPGSTPTPTPSPVPTPTPVPNTAPTVVGPKAGPAPSLSGLPAKIKPSKKGVVKLSIPCSTASGSTDCSGSVRLTARLGKKTQTIGSASFAVVGGKLRPASVKLTSAAKKALRLRSLAATMTATVGGQAVTRSIQLRKIG